MRVPALLCLVWLAACAARGKPASTGGGARETDAAAPVAMDTERMKDDLARQQRQQDEQRSRDDFIGRNQRP